ncbi:hypothetical protein [Ramlibacter tataouinensis]|uniref:Uncharacterized protein n=1 Tax=Ramlibacter tataouinensis (strain ATCC BAA-407 / DSM 14655 / LMG 21543 / TTB310) TaxID=365046 RepID=F5Y1T5_RAMTT|nr:hypothetical protein [Ramlibacter tataouinensis]AEG92336.1 hypothetical protein Rta_12510 [Ramlibacter tataouinensis TTB310]
MAFEVPSRIGQPWEPWEDSAILTDLRLKVDPHVIALRARRTQQEVETRLQELLRPAPRERRRTRRINRA